ncbi:MAG: hypothetical protein GTO24_27680 [candidate division Zixibacteria bacterium]|nr:hypothetical protein [candidate division Zixibacteria bacterium]
MSECCAGFVSKIKLLDLISLSVVLIFFVSLSANCRTESVESKIELKSSVDQSELPFNRELTFTVEASWEGEQGRFSITPVAPPECEKFEILGTSSVNQTKIQEGVTRSLKIFKFTLRPTETGVGRIGSIELSYIDNVTQDSSSLSTQPVSVRVTLPVKEKLSKYQGVLIIVFSLVLVYLLYSVTIKRRRVKIATEEKRKEPISEVESLEDKILKKLDAIHEVIQRGEVETFSSDVYKLLTGYLEARYQIVTTGKTSDDIISSLSSLDLSSERIEMLKPIFSTCDLIKFAKDELGKDRCEETIIRVREFVEQNR